MLCTSKGEGSCDRTCKGGSKTENRKKCLKKSQNSENLIKLKIESNSIPEDFNQFEYGISPRLLKNCSYLRRIIKAL